MLTFYVILLGDGATRDKDGYIFIRGRVDGKKPFYLPIKIKPVI